MSRILVFSTNKAGRHSVGDARVAMQEYGASWGTPEGPMGLSYGIPTKDASIKNLPVFEIERSINKFLKYAGENLGQEFIITRIGCEDAFGYSDRVIAPYFRGATKNCVFPERWRRFLEANATIQGSPF